ncbi:MAG TPA: ABC transporter ATP-binding protein [Actinomycetota bacterium]|nr:ABC transporter ATP-binding protein [Actinomycetota bacterium]
MTHPPIEEGLLFDQLTRAYGSRTVIDRLDLHVPRGSRVALFGPNGSGKTTLIRCAAGSLTPSAGLVLVAGQPAGSYQARLETGVALSQERSFYLRLSARANLVFYATVRLRKRPLALRAVAEVIEELELGDFADVRVDRCSSGMIQQIAFARALLGEPRVLLLDEPTRSLDDAAKNRFWRALDDRPDLSVLLSTHHPDDLTRCQNVVELT